MGKNIRKPQYPQGKNIIKENKAVITVKKKSSVLFIIIAFCIPLLVYLQTIKFGFTHLDDDLIISNNIAFLSNPGNAPLAFLTDQFIVKSTPFYRPIGTLSYMMDIQLSGGNKTWMYHLSNILLLGAVASLLFLLLKRLLIPPQLALLGTLIYCAHPLFVSTAAFIPNRAELLQAFFSLLSFLFFIDFLHKNKLKYLFFHWAAFTIALFCKETAAFLPFLFIIYFFTFHPEKRFEKKYLFIIALYAVSGIFWFWLRSKAIGDISNPDEEFGLMAFLSNLQVIPESVAKFFVYFDFAPIPAFSLIKAIIGLAIIVLIIFMCFKSKERSKKEKIFCFSWFLILMLPPMLYKHPLIEYLDHRFFLPLIGILLFILFIFPKKWLKKGDINRPWLLIVVFIFLSSFTFIKSRSYSDPMTFYNSAISKNSNSAVAYNNRGLLKSDRNDFQGAISDYNKAIALCPTYDLAYYNRGCVKLNNLNDNTGAKADFNMAISINNKYANSYYNRGVANFNLGKLQDAMDDYNKAITIDPGYAKAYYNLGFTKEFNGDYKGAI